MSVALLVFGTLAAGQESASNVDAVGDPLPVGAIARLGTNRLCQERVYFLAFAPDGSRLVTKAADGTLQVWDVKTGKELLRLSVERSRGYSPSWSPLAFSHDSKRLAFAEGNTVRIWDVTSGKEVMKSPGAYVTSAAFAPDDKSLLAVSSQGVSLVDVATGKLLRSLNNSKPVQYASFSSDGKTVVGVGTEGNDFIRRWNATTGEFKNAETFESTRRYLGCLSPDGETFAIPDDEGTVVHLWNTATGKERAVTEGKANAGGQIAFAGDGKTLTTIARDGQLRIWDAATGKLKHHFAVSARGLRRVALSHDGSTATVIVPGNHGIHLWDVVRKKELHTFGGHRNGPLAVAFSADGRTVLSTSRDAGYSSPPSPGDEWSLRRWDARTGKEEKVWRHNPETEVRYAAFASNGSVLATAESSGLLRLIDTSNGKETRTGKLTTQEVTIRYGKEKVVKHQSLSITQLQFSPDRRTLIVSERGKMVLLDVVGGNQVGELPQGDDAVLHCASFPDGRDLLISSWAGSNYSLVRVNPGSPEETSDIPVNYFANNLAVAPTGWSAAVLDRARLHLYELHTGQERGSAELGAWSFALAYSPEGRLLATGGRDGTVRLFDSLTGEAIHRMEAHGGEVSSLAFSPNGQQLVSAGGNVALVWDVAALLRKAPVKLTEAKLNELWRDLALRPAEAAKPLSALANGGEPAATFLLNQLLKSPTARFKNIDRLVADLNSDDFDTRENAARELEAAGDLAEKALKTALAKSPGAEVERRIKKLLDRLGGPPADWLRTRRGLEALKLIGGRSAQEALKRLSKEASDDWVKQEASAAIQRRSP
jgi:WD40 repeat protein